MGWLDGRTALVTGGSSGIGAGLAEALAAQGATVAVTARRADRIGQVADRCRAYTRGSTALVADLADPAAAGKLVERARAALGRVDILVNCAGIPCKQHVTRLDMATVESVMALDYLAPVRLTLAALPHMVAAGWGRIVNVSSVAATLSSPQEAAYGAAKAALSVFSETMAVDLWDTGVKVTVVYPGVVDTELFGPGNPMPVGVDPIPVGDAVAAIMEGLAADAPEVYVPAFFKDIVVGKVSNLGGFLAGSAEFARTNAIPEV